MLSASRDRVEATLRRIRQSEALWMWSVGMVQRSRHRLTPLRGGAATPMIPDLSALSILIVEENTDNRDVFATFLRACGAHVVASRTVDRALQYLDTASVHVIMSDVSVLPAGGAAFIEAIRGLARHRHTPILAVTGWTEKDVRPAECGFTAFMQKPVDLDRLGAEILRLSRAAAGTGAPGDDKAHDVAGAGRRRAS